MKKKLAAITLLFFMTLTGCSQLSDPDTAKKLPDFLEHADLSEHMEISVGFWKLQSMENAAEKDGIWKYLEDLLNITINPVNLNWSDYNERYLIMGVSDTLPDIFAATTISGTSENNTLSLSDMLARNTLSPLPKDLSAYPKVEETINSLKQYLVQEDGNIYTFPRTSFEDVSISSSDAGLLVRKDWMKNLGIEEPQSLDEFIAMTSAFAAKDPDGNGKDDTIGFNAGSRLALGKWLILGIAPECNVFSWVEKDGSYLPSYLLPKFDQVVTAFRKLYKEGGLDPQFYLKKTEDSVYEFAKGTLGALEYKTSPSALAEVESYWNHYHDSSEKFEDSVGILNIFPASDGKRYSNSSSAFWSETLFSSHVDEKKMERILYLFEYLLSDEGWYLTRFGLEGEDYTKEKNTYECLLDLKDNNLSNTLLAKYPSLNLFTSLASWSGTDHDFLLNPENNIRYGETLMEMSSQALNWCKENTTMVERPFDFLQMSKGNSEIFSATSLVEEITNVIIGEDDPVKMWHEVIERWNQKGLEEYINNANTLAIKNLNKKE